MINTLSLKLNPSLTYVVACSGGPDSMALLHACWQQGFSIIIAHMNYHHRDSAMRDQIIVQEFAKTHNIDCYVKDYVPCGHDNFQADARIARYTFFADIIKHARADAVLLAHQKDDVVETFLLQQQRHSFVSFYGLKQNCIIEHVNVIRPLLNYRKNELQLYCDSMHIPYGIDESNLTNEYQRNKLRHDVVEKLSDDQLEEYISQINELNQKLQETTSNDLCVQLRGLLRRTLGVSYGNYKQSYYQDLLQHIFNKGYIMFDTTMIEYSNNEFVVTSIPAFKPLVLDTIEYKSYGEFSFSKSGKIREALDFTHEETPLTIRRVQSGDMIETSFGTKKINRWFIDHKISHRQRALTLVVLNKYGKIIFVSGFGCDSSHYYQNAKVFMLK